MEKYDNMNNWWSARELIIPPKWSRWNAFKFVLIEYGFVNWLIFFFFVELIMFMKANNPCAQIEIVNSQQSIFIFISKHFDGTLASSPVS